MCFPCQPRPAASLNGFFHHRRGIDEHLEVAPRLARQPAPQRFQRALDDIVIIAALRIDGDAAYLSLARQRQRIDRRRVAHAERDHAAHVAPQGGGAARWALRSSIQIMPPWRPSSSHCRNRSPLRGAASACAIPQATKPSAAASALIRASIGVGEGLSFATRARYHKTSRRHTHPFGSSEWGRMVGSSEPAVFAEHLVKRFGERRVVDGVDLSVPRGAIYGVLGPNGAGKTTTLRTLLGIIEPDEGHRSILGHAAPREASDRVGYLPEERGLYPSMKARDAIAFMGALRGLDRRTGRARAAEMMEAAGLAMRSTRRSRNCRRHGAARPAAGIGGASPRPAGARRTVQRPRPGQSGKARIADPRRARPRRDGAVFDAYHGACRARVRPARDHRRRQAPLRRDGGRGAGYVAQPGPLPADASRRHDRRGAAA